jgi:hypothetical protein
MKLYSTAIRFSDLMPPRKQGFEITSTLRASFVIIIIFATCWTIVDTIYNYFFKRLRHLLDFNIYGIKCDRCQYLDCNPYLKCTIHPSTVLTHEAVNCKDYQPINEKDTLKPGTICLPKLLRNII